MENSGEDMDVGWDIGGEMLRKLRQCSLSEKEAGGVELKSEDVKAGVDECRRSLFGKIVGDRPANVTGVKRVMSEVWKLQQGMEVKELSANFFQFLFSSMEDKAKVAAGNNWLFDNQYLILSEWFEGLHSSHPCFDEINIWVQVLNVPLNWLCTEVGMRIGQIFNGVKNVVICKMGGEMGSFIKILVALNVKEPIPRCTVVKLGDNRTTVLFRYERLINLCYYCGMIGHLDRGCKLKAGDIEKGKLLEGQFGEWLKAKETYPGGRSFQASSSDERSTPPHQNSNKASAFPLELENSPSQSPRGKPAAGEGEVTPMEACSNNQKGMEISPIAEELSQVQEGVGREKDILGGERGKQRGVSMPETTKAEVRQQERGVVKAVSTWKRKRAASGRLARNVESEQSDLAKQNVGLDKAELGSLKRGREVVLFEGEDTKKGQNHEEKKQKVEDSNLKVEKASLKWPQGAQ